MNKQNIYNILNNLFYGFENHIFVNNGVWPRNVNLVFAFSDYVEEMTDAEIGGYILSQKKEDIDEFRNIARQGIENWLKENMKTLVI